MNQSSHGNDLTDFFDELSDEELKKYLKLLHTTDRDRVLSLLKFNPDSAGGIMDTNVMTLIQDFTIEKSIQILQRLKPNQDLHHQIYVTNIKIMNWWGILILKISCFKKS